MIKASRKDNKGYRPYAEKLGIIEASPEGKSRLSKAGAVGVDFRLFAGRGSSAMCVVVDADSFDELAGSMIDANPDAAIRAFGAALQTQEDTTIRACGEILSNQRKLAPAVAQTVAA